MNYKQLMDKGRLETESRTSAIMSKIADLSNNKLAGTKYSDFITACKKRIDNIETIYNMAADGSIRKLSLQELQNWDSTMFDEFSEDNYDHSYGNPKFAVEKFGLEMGQMLSFIYSQLEELTLSAYYYDRRKITCKEELFFKAYEYLAAGKENADELRAIAANHQKSIQKELYRDQIRIRIDPEIDFVTEIIKNADLSDLRYLYWFGLHVSDNELKIAGFLNSLPEADIKSMAYTMTEGYRIGFQMTGKDLSKKASASMIYPIGFELIIREAIKNLEAINLKAIIPNFWLESTEINRQFRFDHKSDNAVYLDKDYVEERIAIHKEIYEEVKKLANGYAGPCCVEKFGEKQFDPVNKKEALDLNDEQRDLEVYFDTKASQITRQYIIEEERSFTIIAYPIPEIGEKFDDIFRETVKLNTLDYMLYRNMQQKIIDALDTADYVRVLGKGENRTNINVKLHELTDPSKQTNFENCVADVNIPVGEVFTSPVLKGTNGKLHITGVYLDGLFFKNLDIDFKDGMIEKYNCSNFDTEEENKKYIDENVMFYHKTLPLGEFAIGTNTTAYKMGIEYDIQAKLPVLIAEKTGPHFAVGDTCYSHVEDMKVYNPDGKEIIARTNEVVETRHTDPDKAYFNCHTDITLPYNELAEITAISKDGKETVIIRDGKFVLDGVEELNKPLYELDKIM